MWIVLTILKWIGIVLGGILGLLLFLVALIVFVPVRYRVQGSNRNSITYSFRFSWLLSIVAIVKREQSDKIVLKILGIPIKCLSGGNRKRDKKSVAETTLVEKKPKDNNESPKKEPVESVKKELADEKRTVSVGQQSKRKKKKIFSFDKVSSIIGLVRDSDNRRVVRRLLREVKLLIYYLSPSKVRGTAIVGTGDPCTTGLLFGGISVCPIVYQDGVQIMPDFEEKHFEAEGYIKGRIRVVYFLRLFLRLYQDRELKHLWKQINKVKKEAA